MNDPDLQDYEKVCRILDEAIAEADKILSACRKASAAGHRAADDAMEYREKPLAGMELRAKCLDAIQAVDAASKRLGALHTAAWILEPRSITGR